MTRKRSLKQVKSFEQCVRKFHFILPKEFANTVRKGIKGYGCGINMTNLFIPCEVDFELEYPFWELLRNINLECLPRYDYDPIRTDKGWYPF